jgi:hypothetical protein
MKRKTIAVPLGRIRLPAHVAHDLLALKPSQRRRLVALALAAKATKPCPPISSREQLCFPFFHKPGGKS